MEAVGKSPDWWTAVIHYPVTRPDGTLGDKTKYKNLNTGIMFNESFNIFGLDWDDEEFKWTINENVMWTYKYPRLDQEEGARNPFNDGGFHLLLDVAVGGRMFGIGYGRNKPSYDELCADKDIWTPTQVDWVRVYQQTGNRNMTINTAAGPDTVPGSLGATCLFGGCVGSNWDQEVAEYAALNGIPADQINPGPGQVIAPVPPVANPSDFIAPSATQGAQSTAPVASPAIMPAPSPSNAQGLVASLALMLLAFL